MAPAAVHDQRGLYLKFLMAGLTGFHCNNNNNNNNYNNDNNGSYSPEKKYTRNPGNELSSQLKPMSRALWVNQVSCFVSSLQRSITSADLNLCHNIKPV